MHEGADDLNRVALFVHERQRHAAEDPCLDDLAGDRLENHLQIQRGQHQVPDGAKGRQQLQGLLELTRLLDGFGHLLTHNQGANDLAFGITQGQQLHIVQPLAPAPIMFDAPPLFRIATGKKVEDRLPAQLRIVFASEFP